MPGIGLGLGLGLGANNRPHPPSTEEVLREAIKRLVYVSAAYAEDAQEFRLAPLAVYVPEDDGKRWVDCMIPSDEHPKGNRPPALTTLDVQLFRNANLTADVFNVDSRLVPVLKGNKGIKYIIETV